MATTTSPADNPTATTLAVVLREFDTVQAAHARLRTAFDDAVATLGRITAENLALEGRVRALNSRIDTLTAERDTLRARAAWAGA